MMLGIGRAIGETMAVMMVTGNAANIPALAPDIFFNPVRTMTATIAAEMGEVAQGSLHYSVLFGIGKCKVTVEVMNPSSRKGVETRMGAARAAAPT